MCRAERAVASDGPPHGLAAGNPLGGSGAGDPRTERLNFNQTKDTLNHISHTTPFGRDKYGVSFVSTVEIYVSSVARSLWLPRVGELVENN